MHTAPLFAAVARVHCYALSFNGQAIDVVRGAALNGGSPDPNDPTQWEWRPLDSTFVHVRAVSNGMSVLTSRGGQSASGVLQPRIKWQVWTQDGTRYDFAEDAWWGFCPDSGTASIETARWLLSSVVDMHNNTISYT